MRRTYVLWFGVLCSACGFDISGAPTDAGEPPMTVTVGFPSPTSLQDETSGAILVPVELSAPTTDTVTVRYDVLGGSATAGLDYEASGGVLTFAAGETMAGIPVTILADEMEEDAETINLELSSPTNARLGASRHTVTIASDILPRIRFEPPPTSSALEDTSPELVLTLDVDALPDTTVEYVVEGTATYGDDHMLAGGTLEIPEGARELRLQLPVLDDNLDEYDETVVVRLTSSSNVVIDTAVPEHTHSILNNDSPPTISLAAATHTVMEGDPNGYALTFSLSGPSGKPISVPYSVDASSTATQGLDFAFSQMTQTVTFAPGETTQTVMITFPDDNVYEGDELAVIVLGAPTNVTLGAITRLELTIVDNEPVPTVSWGDPQDQTVNERDNGSRDYTYNLVLSGPSAKTVTLSIAVSGTAGENDFSTPNGLLVTFAPGALTMPFLIRVFGDNRDENNETIEMTISSVINAQIGTPSVRTHTIRDDD